MENKEVIQNYINNFRRDISRFLKPDIGINSTVYPCVEDGAIIEFKFGQGIPTSDEYKPSFKKLSDALKTIPQNAFGGNLDGFKFLGTNYVMEFHRLILIKDDSESEWTEKKATEDVFKFVAGGKSLPK